LSTIVMGALTGWAVARQAGTRVGIFASVVLSSCLMQAIIGRLAIMDALLDLAVALTIFFWFRAIEAGRDRYFVYGWIAAALGFLAKGPVALVIALLVIGVFALWNRRAESTRLPSVHAWVWGVLVMGAFVAPWLIAIAAHSGVGALVQLIGHYTIGRYTGVIENQAGPVWYYLPVVILGFFPWIAFLPMALAYGIRALRSPETPVNIARLWRLAFSWILVPLLFFSFARTKLPNYIALEFPAFALVTALYFEAVVKKGASRSVVISSLCVSVTIGMCAIAIALFVRDNRLASSALAIAPDLAVMGTSIFAGSIVTAVLFARREWMGIAPYGLGAAMLVAVDVLAVVALPHAEPFKPIPFFAATIQAGRKPGDAVAIQSFRGANALVFYTMPPVYALGPAGAKKSDEGIDPRGVICSHARVWLVAPKKRPAFDPLYGRSRRLIEENGSGALYLIDGPACR
ncbi:MAG TPA: glycosyltransferase family 39 protein, partial [Candidatus Baltobacteraceae bacterium]|nr:glycosyltransferase family 39 protein [Candidatus Baltobacteraceae bacterium]